MMNNLVDLMKEAYKSEENCEKLKAYLRHHGRYLQEYDEVDCKEMAKSAKIDPLAKTYTVRSMIKDEQEIVVEPPYLFKVTLDFAELFYTESTSTKYRVDIKKTETQRVPEVDEQVSYRYYHDNTTDLTVTFKLLNFNKNIMLVVYFFATDKVTNSILYHLIGYADIDLERYQEI